jgi:RNA polymerase sigma factor (sigma-70 family)
MTDIEIMEGLKTRNTDVLKYILKRFYPMTKDLGLRKNKVMKVKKIEIDDEAQDILQDVLQILINAVDQDKIIVKTKFSTILYKFAEYQWLSRLKKMKIAERHHDTIEAESEELYLPGYDNAFDYEKLRNAMNHYFEQISEKCRKILEMIWAELPVNLVAKKIGLTRRGLITRKYKCKERLIHLIKMNPDNI